MPAPCRRFSPSRVAAPAWLIAALTAAAAAGGPRDAVGAASASPAGTTASVTLYPVADAYIDQARPAQNFDTASEWPVERDENGRERLPLWRFDTAGIPADTQVTAAELTVNVTSGSGDSPVRIIVERITLGWDPSTVTWNNRPPTQGTWGAWDTDRDPGPRTFDVRVLVTNWVRGSMPNHGLRLSGPASGTYERLYRASGATRPRLEVTYIDPTPTPTATATATSSATASATATPTPSATPSATATATPIATPTPTASATATPTATATLTPSPTALPTFTATAPPPVTATATATATLTATASPTSTLGATPTGAATETPVATDTPVPTDTAVASPTSPPTPPTPTVAATPDATATLAPGAATPTAAATPSSLPPTAGPSATPGLPIVGRVYLPCALRAAEVAGSP